MNTIAAIEVFRSNRRVGSAIHTVVITSQEVFPGTCLYTYERIASQSHIRNPSTSKHYTAVGPAGLTTASELLELFLRSEAVINERLLSL